MSDNTLQQTARLEARVNPEIKASVQEAAYNVIQQHQTLKLSLEDAEAFVEALQNPPKPSDSLVAAALRYKQIIQKNVVND